MNNYLTFSTYVGYELGGEYIGSVKQADASLKKSQVGWPIVVVEVDISETTQKLYTDAERWLEGSNSRTKLVILVVIRETGKRDTASDSWELFEDDFREMNPRRLFQHISEWYPLDGSTFSVPLHYLSIDGTATVIDSIY